MQEIVRQVLTIARAMWKFRWPSLAVAWIVAIAGAVVVWRIPDRFEASARIYVDTDSILKPLMAGLAIQPNFEQQIGMLSRTLISRPNLEKLVRMADLDLKSSSKPEQDALVDKLQKGIAIRTAGGPNLYSMSYRDTDPERAKRVVQAMVSIFVESGLGASRKDADSAKAFLTEQIKTFEAKLEEAEARLKEFRLRNIERQGVDGKDATTRLGEISSQLENARLQLREAERARDAAKKQLAEERGSSSNVVTQSILQESEFSVATPEIDGRIEVQRRNLDGLLQRFTDQHPDVIQARRLIAELESQRRKEVAELRKVATARANLSPQGQGRNSLAVEELNRMAAAAEVQVAGLQARVDEFSMRLANVREQLKTAPQIEAEAAQLNRDYEVTKKNYEDLVARRQAAVMSGELDVASGVAEFRLIDPPRAAPRPVAPNRLMLFPLVLFGALAAGVAIAFAASQLRPTFNDGEELRARTGLPLLGVVSAVVSEGERRRARASMLRFATASGGLVGFFAVGMVALLATGRYGA